MDKKLIKELFFIILGIMIVFPIFINSLMSFRFFPHLIPVKGDYQVWAPVLGTFWGAILGGVISGVLTLFGVNKSIKASFEALEVSRNKDLEISMARERLKELYQPVEILFLEFAYEYNAHSFEDLTENERAEFIALLNKNIVYADFKLDLNFTELKWAYKQGDFEISNNRYNQIMDLISTETIQLREQLKLPNTRHDLEENYKRMDT